MALSVKVFHKTSTTSKCIVYFPTGPEHYTGFLLHLDTFQSHDSSANCSVLFNNELWYDLPWSRRTTPLSDVSVSQKKTQHKSERRWGKKFKLSPKNNQESQFFSLFFFLITRPSTMSKYKLGTLKIFKLLYILIRSQHLLSRPATHFLNASRWFIPSVFHSSELWVSWCISAEFRLMNHVCTISSSIIKRSYKRSAKLQIRETVNNTFRVRLYLRENLQTGLTIDSLANVTCVRWCMVIDRMILNLSEI